MEIAGNMTPVRVLCVLLLGLVSPMVCVKYEPTWSSIDSRPLPGWYDDVKIGIFIHWGVFSVPSFGSEWFWENWQGSKVASYVKFMEQNYRPGFTYADFAPQFTAEFYNADQWAEIFDASGAKYVVLVSKHHEGFTNWPSKVSWNWNSMDVGPKRDLVGELATAVRKKQDIHFGIYHSLFEWFNPLYLQDKANKFATQDFVARKTMPELMELVNNYKPDVIWSDGDWEALDTYWNSTQFLAWLYNESPVKDTVLVNDRWGSNTHCKHGGFYNCNDRYNPGVLQKHKWENAMTLDRHSWGYRREIHLGDLLTMDDLTQVMAETVSCGGNLLVNIGPTHDGRIIPIFEERLRDMGSWLKVNGEAIYSSKPWAKQNDTVTKGVWYTSQKGASGTDVYAIVLNWPKNGTVTLGAATGGAQTTVTMLGNPTKLPWTKNSSGGIDVTMSKIPTHELPCQWAWTLKLQQLANA